jgi:uncharacterized protein (TIGR03435 family)
MIACALKRVQRAGFTALIFAASCPAQPSAAASPEFEVASIKPMDPNAAMHRTGLQIFPSGRVVIPTTSLKGLIVTAFGLSYWQISGGVAWMEKDEYDVEAQPAANLQPTITNLRHGLFDIDDERVRRMLQALLTDRFHLRFHHETRTGKVYLLERKGSTQALRVTDDESVAKYSPGDSKASSIGFAGAKWNMFNTSMPQLAKFAADHILHAPVLDRTELEGHFNYRQTAKLLDSEVDYGSENTGPFLLFLQEIGLKLETVKGPVETFVIDSAEKPLPN